MTFMLIKVTPNTTGGVRTPESSFKIKSRRSKYWTDGLPDREYDKEGGSTLLDDLVNRFWKVYNETLSVLLPSSQEPPTSVNLEGIHQTAPRSTKEKDNRLHKLMRRNKQRDLTKLVSRGIQTSDIQSKDNDHVV